MDGGLRVDTPYILQDGHMMRVLLKPSGSSEILATDDAWAQEQLEIFLGKNSQDYDSDLAGIARALGLRWEHGEFTFVEMNVESLARRIALLAEAVDRALSFTRAPARSRPVRPHYTPKNWQVDFAQVAKPVPLQIRFGQALADFGLLVQRKVVIRLSSEVAPTKVDYLVRRNGSEAAIDLVAGRGPSQARSSIDRAAVDFCLLDDSGYRGYMVAVYDEHSAAAKEENLDRFSAAAPERAVLVAESEALPMIAERLALASN